MRLESGKIKVFMMVPALSAFAIGAGMKSSKATPRTTLLGSILRGVTLSYASLVSTRTKRYGSYTFKMNKAKCIVKWMLIFC